MSYVTANGVSVMTGQVTLPRYGRWVADLVLVAATDLDDAVTVIVGNMTLVGTHFRSIAYGGSRSVRVVAGHGGWDKMLPAKAYKPLSEVRYSTVAIDAAVECGERMVVDAGVDFVLGSSYVRRADLASAILTRGPSWYVDLAAITRAGARASKPVISRYEVTGVEGSSGKITVATEDPASWQPENTFTPPILGTRQTIQSVTHMIDGGTVRTEVLVL